jgi:hypothetical protein
VTQFQRQFAHICDSAKRKCQRVIYAKRDYGEVVGWGEKREEK